MLRTDLADLYRQIIDGFRRMRASAVGIAVVGAAAGFLFAGATRIVVWALMGVSAASLLVASFAMQARYRRKLTALAARNETRDASGEDASVEAAVARQRLALQKHGRFYAIAAVAVILVASAGVLVGLQAGGAVRFDLIFTSISCGILLSALFLWLRNKIRSIEAE